MLPRQAARCGTVSCSRRPFSFQGLVANRLTVGLCVCVGLASAWTENKDQLEDTKRQSKDYAWQEEVISQELPDYDSACCFCIRTIYQQTLLAVIQHLHICGPVSLSKLCF